MKSLLIAAILALNTGCAMGVGVPQADGSKPVEVVFHGDKNFSLWERSVIQGSAQKWTDATGGLAQIHFYWDLGADKGICSLTPCLYRNEEDDEEVFEADFETCHPMTQCVLGWVTNRGGIRLMGAGKPQQLHLIPSREVGFLGEVATHELGHVLGLSHVRDPWAIMYPAHNKNQTGCITQSDMSEYCRVNQCGTHQLFPCEASDKK